MVVPTPDPALSVTSTVGRWLKSGQSHDVALPSESGMFAAPDSSRKDHPASQLMPFGSKAPMKGNAPVEVTSAVGTGLNGFVKVVPAAFAAQSASMPTLPRAMLLLAA